MHTNHADAGSELRAEGRQVKMSMKLEMRGAVKKRNVKTRQALLQVSSQCVAFICAQDVGRAKRQWDREGA